MHLHPKVVCKFPRDRIVGIRNSHTPPLWEHQNSHNTLWEFWKAHFAVEGDYAEVLAIHPELRQIE